MNVREQYRKQNEYSETSEEKDIKHEEVSEFASCIYACNERGAMLWDTHDSTKRHWN